MEAWEKGGRVATEYDQKGDSLSVDVCLMLEVTQSMGEPLFHRAFPGGLENLELYRREVVEGVHDDWIHPTEKGKWRYTYHERLFAYKVPGMEPIDQIEKVIEQLARVPHSRRALAITWYPWYDPLSLDPPCAEQFWFRIFGDQLYMDMHIRSNDAFKAAFMNMFAFVHLQRLVADRLTERLGRVIVPGRYVHIADSFHIYGRDHADFAKFMELSSSRTLEGRTWRSYEKLFANIWTQAGADADRILDHEAKTGTKGVGIAGIE
ncbi:MAG: thymidylate synthase [Candidatus Berkelbacteria bacterium Licking1014_96]|uniref:Thymidylate synthase n=1 Tax=Candidatus Berkelbacteria bacterium Licking1014_96 TaxID=2017149 RepID=A0A554LH03_9BACT|nr:MAG: thymidylate synthase [Candidatus Berkelbacteria bacterium Licking1014_96]